MARRPVATGGPVTFPLEAVQATPSQAKLSIGPSFTTLWTRKSKLRRGSVEGSRYTTIMG